MDPDLWHILFWQIRVYNKSSNPNQLQTPPRPTLPGQPGQSVRAYLVLVPLLCGVLALGIFALLSCIPGSSLPKSSPPTVPPWGQPTPDFYLRGFLPHPDLSVTSSVPSPALQGEGAVTLLSPSPGSTSVTPSIWLFVKLSSCSSFLVCYWLSHEMQSSLFPQYLE